VLLLLGTIVVWVDDQALDTDEWVATSARLLDEDDIREAIATRVVEAFVRPQLRPAALAAAGAVLDRPDTRRIWEEANRVAHRQIVALLDDDAAALRVAGGDVVLDLRPLRAVLRRELGENLGGNAAAGRIVVLRAGRLEPAQDAVKAVRDVSSLVLFAVPLLALLAIGLARGMRLRVLGVLAAGTVVVGVILLILRRVAGELVVAELTGSATRDAGLSAWSVGTDGLRESAVRLIVAGAVVLVASVAAGPLMHAHRGRREQSASIGEW